MNRLVLLIVAALVLISGLIIAYPKYKAFFLPNVPAALEDPYLHIPSGADFQQVVQLLHAGGFVVDTSTFKTAAKRMNYIKPTMRSGRFKIETNWSNINLIRHLRGGQQATVKLVLTNERLPENVAAKVARFIEPDSVALLESFSNVDLLEELGYTRETLMSLFIPNTYDFYWNTTPRQFLERMQKEHDAFWEKDDRKAKAEKWNLTPEEVYTLASIVEKETNQNGEKKRMAGVYLNRLEKNMLLQADPTCVFATRDFDAPRVLNFHLEFDSPYNTYMYTGLPPGPIAMASISSIDAVLNAEDHDYIFFCARGDGTGFHNFAETLRGHNQNIRTYQANLRNRGLR